MTFVEHKELALYCETLSIMGITLSVDGRFFVAWWARPQLTELYSAEERCRKNVFSTYSWFRGIFTAASFQRLCCPLYWTTSVR